MQKLAIETELEWLVEQLKARQVPEKQHVLCVRVFSRCMIEAGGQAEWARKSMQEWFQENGY